MMCIPLGITGFLDFVHCLVLKAISWNREIPKQCKTTNYNVCFKLILTYNAKTGALTKRNKSKMQQ
jgi:hypothetical protein